MALKFPFLSTDNLSIESMYEWSKQLVDTLNKAKIITIEPVDGTLRLWPSDAPMPEGYIPADGSMLEMKKHRMLYLAYGYSYGGGGELFKLPDYTGVLPGINVIVKA